jgi:succinate dehydrogenase / fumarate reductase flavoprotein subunit
MYDVLIIGAGGAGLSASLVAKQNGAKVGVVSESYPTRSQTSMAQGGINAALSNVDSDSIKDHIEDTLKASGSIGDKNMIVKMCENAPDSVKWLESIGMPFSRTDDKKIAQRRLGGASSKRACYAQDFTGLKILHTLYDQCLKEGIEFLNEKFLLDLSVVDNMINGVTLLDIRTTEVEYIKAKSVIVATGGYSALYYNFTTNTDASTGDGIVAALRAGAKLSHMEFVQFHPTGLEDSGMIGSESARGAGGKLITDDGERFVDELKPRDEVSRAIYEQIQKGKEVFLDIRHLGEEFINEQIPQERKLSITYEGVDPVDELIPIAPVAHYSMGGISVDENMMSSIKGLFAVGECAQSGVHGANRLGGNSLLEIISFGRLVGERSVDFAKTINIVDHEMESYNLEKIFDIPNEINFYKKREELGKELYKNVGIVRDEKSLKYAFNFISGLENDLDKMGLGDGSRVYNTNLIELLKFRNSVALSKIIVQSALDRKESIGAHYRED